ncbi:MAG: PGF-pre-PGF domain-containing protein, partial [Deltaproteobacteria bacterium]|nr:PGF-pre-PGF domain-containing protein [Deltaproteobacteria bacterium]
WYHVAVVRTVTPNKATFYIGGQSLNTEDLARTPVGSTNSVFIGKRGGTTYPFNGSIDEVRIYNRALSGDEIYRQYIRSKYAANAPTAVLGEATSDTTAPTLISVARDNDTQITVTMSESVTALGPGDGGFTVTKTGDTTTYTVSKIATGGSDEFVVLTVADMAASGGVTVTYNATNNGTITDIAGNALETDTTGVAVAMDTTAPTLTISSPLEGHNYSTVTLNVTANEGITAWWYNVNGTGNTSTLGTSTLDVTLPTLPDGDNNVTVYANDSAGNVGSAMVNFTIDTIPPTAPTIDVPGDGETLTSAYTWVNGTTSADTTNVTVYVNGSIKFDSVAVSANIFNISNVPLGADGSREINVSAIDAAGNVNTTNATVIVTVDDIFAPTLTISSPLEGYNYNTNTTSLNVTVTANENITAWWYNVNGTGNTSTFDTSTLDVTLPTLPEGTHNVTVFANDTKGNVGSAMVNFTIDTIPPVIHNVSLSDTSPSYDQKIVVSVNVTDTNIYSVTATGNSSLKHQSGMLWNGTITAGYGTNTVTVTAYDNASNAATNSSLSYTGPAAPTPSRSSGGGGGGGGGTSGELYENIVSSETDRQYVNQNSDISYSFELENNIVQFVKFTSLKSAGQVATKVEMLKDTSALVDNPPSDIVYKNLNIWVGNAGWATGRNIADVTVVFTVDKSWITKNNIDESSIALYRYSDNNWNKLVTRKIAGDDNSLQFEAETPGFSPFVVTGKEIMGETGDEDIIVAPTVTAEKTAAPTPTEGKGMPGFGLFVSLSVLLTAVGLLHKKN